MTLAYRNGRYLLKSNINIGIEDLGFERGFAVFEYIREQDGKILFLNDHLQRLNHSQSLLNFHSPADLDEIENIVLHLQKENQLIDSYFKIVISAIMIDEIIQPVITIYQDKLNEFHPSHFEKGVNLIISEYSKPFPDFKTTFYLGSLKEYSRMREYSAEDVLFYSENNISECSRCNIFIVKDTCIYTPNKNILPGITRKHVINCAAKKYSVIEKDISLAELYHADEVFISSTTKNVMPVVKIENSLISKGFPGAITKDLIQLFNAYRMHYLFYL